MGMWSYALAYLAAGLGAGLVTFGAGFGIGKIAAAAMDGTARQPEAGGAIRITMIIAAAMIEGIALFGVVVCFLLASIKP
ncbi:ATP synthase subunit c [Caldithrix abyssi DSM 13497]|uniref:ATP synthase subunit c n=2 Tax=Caldithrix abyssi TaxID=187145 RepID=H1XNU5_CALAY|nr:ATP synthase F0 subunit C [Caldithrix abyssi]APF19780.1 ATP synthase F0 subcomplex C subunit [Caldithrix abyssi DSM 13497]EHO39885.1 ATP synthase subunit c [Caldithrix abyssi DSM 13497]